MVAYSFVSIAEQFTLKMLAHYKRTRSSKPPGIFAKEGLYSRKQWRHTYFIANCVWSRWILAYVPTLQQRHKRLLNRVNLSVKYWRILGKLGYPARYEYAYAIFRHFTKEVVKVLLVHC